MKVTCRILVLTTVFGLSVRVLPADQPAQVVAGKSLTEERIQAPTYGAKATKNKLESKRPGAITISLTPLQKSAEPLPLLMLTTPEQEPKGKKGKVAAHDLRDTRSVAPARVSR